MITITIIITGSIITIIIWVVNTCIIIIHRALDLEKKMLHISRFDTKINSTL